MSERAGISIKELGERTGISSRTINNSVHILVEMMEKRDWKL